jgi:hypothetical protein
MVWYSAPVIFCDYSSKVMSTDDQRVVEVRGKREGRQARHSIYCRGDISYYTSYGGEQVTSACDAMDSARGKSPPLYLSTFINLFNTHTTS